MAFKWYNPMTWGFFGYTDPTTGDYVEVDLEVGGKRTKAGVRVTPKTALSISMVWSCVKILSESLSGLPPRCTRTRRARGRWSPATTGCSSCCASRTPT